MAHTAGRFLGLTRDSAARFSFLLSIPAVTAAGLYKLKGAWSELGDAGLGPLAVATLVSGIVGYASLGFLLRFLRTRSILPFVAYRLVLAGAIVLLISSGRLAALPGH